jgi:hypothetical protein
MSGRTPGRPGDEAHHPQLLPWYVSGALEPSEALQVEAHLKSCPECRDEVCALQSMKETMTRHGRADHITEEDLVSYEAGEMQDSARRKETEDHLGSCASCRRDLQALESARERGEGGATEPTALIHRRTHNRSAGNPWMWGFLATSALAAGLAVPLFTMWSRGYEPPLTPSTGTPGPVHAPEALPSLPPAVQSDSHEIPVIATDSSSDLEEATAVTLHPAWRGDSTIPSLEGSGPWAITVALPFGAPEGDYKVHVERNDRSTIPGTSTSVRARPEGVLTVLLRRLQFVGRGRLVLTPAENGQGRSYMYEFQHPADGEERGK